MQLFDDFVRTDSAPASHSEPHFPFYNRSAWPETALLRGVLEEWFRRYPESEQSELRQRFRSTVNHQFDSAFFELYLHELLLREGYSVKVHPEGDTTKRPDFLVQTPNGAEFYLEAAVASNKTSQEQGAANRAAEVYDAINAIDSPNFFVSVDVDGPPPSPVPKRRLQAAISAFVGGLDPDGCAEALKNNPGMDGLPSFDFQHDGWSMTISAIPKSPEARGKPGLRALGALFGGAEWVDERGPLRTTLISKASRYGDLRAPFYIAVNAINQHLDKISIMEALFGKETYTLDGVTEPEMIRQADGLWTSPRRPRYTRVSGVLVCSALVPFSTHVELPRVYQNPWAKYPLPNVLPSLPRTVPVGDKMIDHPGADARRFFELPDGWDERGGRRRVVVSDKPLDEGAGAAN